MATVDPPRVLERQLHEERRQGDVADGAAVDLVAVARPAEALAVVGGDDDQRAVIEPGGAQLVERTPEQAIGELDL